MFDWWSEVLYMFRVFGGLFINFFKFIGSLLTDGPPKPPQGYAPPTPKIPKELFFEDKNRNGIFFGRKNNYTIIKPREADGHVLVVGGVGSGKTSCVAIPSLLQWNRSDDNGRIFCIDIKGELYSKTKDFKPDAKVFDPLRADTYGYDPFYFLHSTDNRAQEAHAIALALIPLTPDVREPFWIECAQNLLTGAMLYYYNQGLSFIDTLTKIQSTPIADLVYDIHDDCRKISDNPDKTADEKDTANEIILFINNFVDMESRTLYSIYSTLSNNIVPIVANKNMCYCLSRDENISPADLENGADIFFCIPENLLKHWKNLISLIVNQFMSHFERRPDMTDTDMSAPPILFLLDEFPRLGKIDGITDALATLRSKKITICPIIQSLAQLDRIYGKETRQIIVDTCQYKAILNVTEADNQEYFSKMVGTYEKLKYSSDARQSPIGTPAGSGAGITTEERRTIKPEDFATLTDIVLFTPHGVYRVNKAPYYTDESKTEPAAAQPKHIEQRNWAATNVLSVISFAFYAPYFYNKFVADINRMAKFVNAAKIKYSALTMYIAFAAMWYSLFCARFSYFFIFTFFVSSIFICFYYFYRNRSIRSKLFELADLYKLPDVSTTLKTPTFLKEKQSFAAFNLLADEYNRRNGV